MPDLDREDWLHMYEQMAKIRAFEEQVNELYQAAQIPGLAHLYIGEEPIAVGVFEDKMMYKLVKGPVPEAEYTIPLGVADIKREGSDVTIVATSSMVYAALEAAKQLAEIGLSAEVVDPRTLLPLDKPALIESAKKTGHAIVVDEGYEQYGVTAELASVMAEGVFYYLDAPVRRIGAMNVPIPFSPPLEDLTIPNAAMIVETAKALCGRF